MIWNALHGTSSMIASTVDRKLSIRSFGTVLTCSMFMFIFIFCSVNKKCGIAQTCSSVIWPYQIL